MNAPITIRRLADPDVVKYASRLVTQVHQIEVTSRCNLRCHYCPHYPNLPREKADMTMETFEQALRLVDHYVVKGTQHELALTGIGEPLLHPDFVYMLELARECVGPGRPITFSTNGILVTDELAKRMQPFNPRVFVSFHRPEKAMWARETLLKHGLLGGVNTSALTSSMNWGGKVKWPVTAPRITCEYLNAGWCVVLQDGKVTTCCLDADNAGVVGDVWTPPDQLALRPFSLCSTCHMNVPEALQ